MVQEFINKSGHVIHALFKRGNMQTYTIVQRIDDLSKEISDKLEAALKQANRIRNDENPEVVFVIGGDGTFLYAVHKYIDKIENMKFYGLHTGTLGFFTDYSDNEYDTFLEQFLTNDLSTISYPLLKVDTGKQIYYALNEMRIENVARTQVLHISVDDDFFSVNYMPRAKGCRKDGRPHLLSGSSHCSEHTSPCSRSR